jgi:hypothetical protein
MRSRILTYSPESTKFAMETGIKSGTAFKGMAENSLFPDITEIT